MTKPANADCGVLVVGRLRNWAIICSNGDLLKRAGHSLTDPPRRA